MAGDTDASSPDLRDIQGNLLGFNKDHQRLLFLAFPDAAAGRAFLADSIGDIATAFEVKAFNALYKAVRARGGEDGTVEASWTNIALTASGLQMLGAPGIGDFPPEFTQDMAARADQIGDVDDSAPGTWIAPFDTPHAIHAMVIIASDSTVDRDADHQRLQARLAAHNVRALGHQDGDVRPGAARGHEHFGFKDGISQPGVRGLTVPSKKTTHDAVAAGEFIVGYPDESGEVSALPTWARNGSFVVYRRLRQDVPAFKAFLQQQAGPLGLTPDQLAAKLVGRWWSGAPMEPIPGLPKSIDPAQTDPSTAYRDALADDKINRFDYDGDPDGTAVPRAAHIRKVNPRRADRHRILRRGIPYGAEHDDDRGLLFLCYQASIARGFEFIQHKWANAPDFPAAGDGEDPLIAQSVPQREFALPPHGHLTMARWVSTTAGAYFFSPSISGLRALSRA